MDTTIARFLAVVLIANSHLEELYPVRQLAADGLIGNSLFFLLSGLGLELGAIAKGRVDRFPTWYARRLGRIYPALWLVVIGFTLVGQGAWHAWGPADYVRNLLWPTPYGFVAQIVIFYAAFHALMTRRDPRLYLGLALVLALPYAVVAFASYDLHVLSWLFYAQMMLLGGWLAGRAQRFGRNPRRDALILAGSLAVYVAIKAAMSLGKLPTHAAPLHLLTVPILLSILGLFAAPGVRNAINGRTWLARPVTLLAALTLEIYLVHGFVHESHRVSDLPFPLNIAAFWAVTIPLAWCVGRLVERIKRVRIATRAVRVSAEH